MDAAVTAEMGILPYDGRQAGNPEGDRLPGETVHLENTAQPKQGSR